MLYLAVSAGYLAAVIVATIFAAGVCRWLLAAGAFAAGVVLVVPVRCWSLPFFECESTEPRARCTFIGSHCETMLGISVPYVDEITMTASHLVGIGSMVEVGMTASHLVGIGIVAVAVLASFLTPRYRTPTSERLAAPTAQPDV
jgi:hypothetical protein